LIPLSLHIILWQTSPFWTVVLAYFINKEPIQKIEYLAMSLCFAGVVAIALSKTNQTLASSNKFLGICVSFSTAWFLALVGVLNRRLKNVHYTVVSFWHPFTGTIFSFLYVLYMLIAKGTVFDVHQW
jgi:drug/metabolite transporter (DMT)-like permease